MRAPDLSHVVWRKSTRSSETGGNCVEVAAMAGLIIVRDSKSPAEPAFVLKPSAWSAFLDLIKNAN
jgi:hypothetical protein